MIKQLRRTGAVSRAARPAVFHFPLHRLALCLDCEMCFEIGPDRCRACGSETWFTLARFLELRGEPHMNQVIVVSRQRPKLHERLKRAFAGNRSVQVILDRRKDDPPHGGVNGHARPLDRRAADKVRTAGWTVVRRSAPPSP
ncbi:MAG: hypothetical protein ACREM3_23580 [Candidatus Rokuibacteriota bacterium]